jgi:hypothetical protein
MVDSLLFWHQYTRTARGVLSIWLMAEMRINDSASPRLIKNQLSNACESIFAPYGLSLRLRKLTMPNSS